MLKQQTGYQQVLLLSFILLFWASTSAAQMYKWVDADGQTHYSDKKHEAGSKAQEVKVKHSKQVAPPVPKYNPRLLDEQQEARNAEAEASAQARRSDKRDWGGDQVETDATRCALARDILSGAAKHGNGVVTDSNDKQVAQNDVRSYCH